MEDVRVIGSLVGRILIVAGGAGAVPLIWAMAAAEWHPMGSLLLMVGIYGFVGVVLAEAAPDHRPLPLRYGIVVVALAWLIVPLIGSIPLVMSGHFGDPLDAMFDSVSGLTTTGLSVMSDLDHLAGSLNVWRHLLQFVGGFGIVGVALTLFAGPFGIALYQGEGHSERFLPSTNSMIRFFWRVAVVHLVVVGGALVAVAWWVLGFEPGRALLHGVTMFFAGFSTGGFAPQSTSIGYYHSTVFESLAAVSMIAGAVSFGVHHALWRGDRRSVVSNLESQTILGTFAATLVITLVGLAVAGSFTSLVGLGHHGSFQVFSAHTTTGWSTISSAELSQWGGLAFVGMMAAMAIGGMGSATAGGVKAIRVGLGLRVVRDEIRRSTLPEGAIVPMRYTQGGVRTVTPEVARSVMVISLLFVALYLFGAAVGFAYGIPLPQALFESVSASATVGLSIGVTDESMPAVLQLVYILQMWAGRLEFVALFALVGFVHAAVRGR